MSASCWRGSCWWHAAARHPFPYVFLDATTCTCAGRAAGHIHAVVVATGVTGDGGRQSVGRRCRRLRKSCFGAAPIRTLRKRGLSGVSQVISHQHAGLAKLLPDVPRRGDMNAAGTLHPPAARAGTEAHKDIVATVFLAIFVQPDAGAVAATWEHRADQLAIAFPRRHPRRVAVIDPLPLPELQTPPR
jgi:transposase-like protein